MIKRNFLFLMLTFIVLSVSIAQQQHFMFIQSDNRQPFNVTMAKTNYSSSANGYLVIPKLANGEYSFTIGFAGNEIKDQPFHCVIDKKDIGFTLKQFGDKGWGLFNLQTFEILMANQKPTANTKFDVVKQTPKAQPEIAPEPQKPIEKKDEPVVKPKDSVAIVKVTAPAKGPEKIDTPKVVIEQQEVKPVVPDPIPQKPEVNIPTANTAPQKQLGVFKYGESGFNTGLQLTYIEVDATYSDTIRVFIPYQSASSSNQSSSSSVGISVDTTVKAFNTNCISLAADDDFFKLRRKMSAESEDGPMINAAKKVFKAKCFTVQQIKNLSTLFLNDNGRYQFFEAAYPFAYDVYKFNSLIAELTDIALINKFTELTKSK